MKKRLQKIVSKLRNSPVEESEFFLFLESLEGFFCDPYQSLEYIKANGLPIENENGSVYLRTALTPYMDDTYCIVDIETNGSKPNDAQIIELGAIKIAQGKVVDRFESFVKCETIPEYITKITGIREDDVKDAPTMQNVLIRFREFLGQAVFVAHNVEFDFNFISAMYARLELGFLANRKLCTIDLARKTIEAERYGLEHLNSFLEINTEVSHRAYADALTAARVFDTALANIPARVLTTEDLIEFSKSSVKKEKKKEPNGEEPQIPS